MNLPLVSVIVPVYKVEPFLERCLESIVNQTYRHLEIILVDDGSPDACGTICDRYALKDSRIRVIHKKNGGLSSARNAGLDIVTGDYISFVDSDDYIATDMYENLVKEVSDESPDIVIFDYFIVDSAGIRAEKSKLDKNIRLEEMQEMILLDQYPSYVWNKFFRATLFGNVRMSLRRFEDLMVMPEIFLKARKIAYLPKPFYYYNHISDTSLTSSVNVNNKLNAVSKYGLFRAWQEHEKIARRVFPSAVQYSELRAMNSAVGGLVADIFKPVLSESERKEIRHFLDEKKKAGSAKIHTKYKILWWMADHCPGLCRVYGNIGLAIFKLKARLKSRKK